MKFTTAKMTQSQNNASSDFQQKQCVRTKRIVQVGGPLYRVTWTPKFDLRLYQSVLFSDLPQKEAKNSVVQAPLKKTQVKIF